MRNLEIGRIAKSMFFVMAILAVGTLQANPHWSAKGCPTCHVDATPGSPAATLIANTAEETCHRCHGEDVRQCPHVSEVPAGNFLSSMPDDYRESLQDGAVVCTTCHDLSVQCLNPKRSQRYKNPGFLRGGRFDERTEQCFGCHEKSGFKQLSPHMQVRGKDNIKQGTCLLCHESLPMKVGDSSWTDVRYNVKGDMNDVCRGCHNVGSHPTVSFGVMTEWAHLAVPPIEMGQRMRRTAEDTGAIFPLDLTSGKIYCATCHNAHDKKLAGYPVAAEPGSRLKLRIDNICGACHEK